MLFAADARAQPRALRDVNRNADIALAGSDVLVAEVHGGSVRVLSVPLQGGPPRRRFGVHPPRPGWTPDVVLAASPQRAALLVFWDDAHGNPAEWTVFSGPPPGPWSRLVDLRGSPGRRWIPVDVDVDGDHLLVGEIRFHPHGYRLRVFEPSRAPLEAPLEALATGPPAIAGDRVAYFQYSSRSPVARPSRILIGDWRSGTLRGRVAVQVRDGDIDGLDLTPDGRVVASIDGRVAYADPGQLQADLVGKRRQVLRKARFAGSKIAVLQDGRFEAARPAVFDSVRSPLRVIGPPSTGLSAFAVDERTAAWIANGCLLAVGLDDPAFSAPPPGPCPRAEVILEEGEQVLRGRRAQVIVTCVAAPPPGCRGVAKLVGVAVAKGAFRVRAGHRKAVNVAFSRGGARKVRRAIRRTGEALFGLRAQLRGGRLSPMSTIGALIERALPR